MTSKCRYGVGETVVYFPDGSQDRSSGAGLFEITRVMPDERAGPSYKIKHSVNGHERIAREHQLETTDAGISSEPNLELTATPRQRPERIRRKSLRSGATAGLQGSQSMATPHSDAQIEQVKATVRRIRAAVSASEEGITDEAVVLEVSKMLESDGLRNLLANSEPSVFVGVIDSVQKVVREESSSAEILNHFREILGSQVLTAALATDEPDEQPSRLVQLMLDGPFKEVSAGGNH